MATSTGVGIEREAIHAAFKLFEGSTAQWFTPRADDFFTPATSHSMATSRYVTAARLADLTILGALTALLLIHGIAPGRLDPVFLQYLVYDCDIEAVHSTFLGEWHPSIRQTIMQWLAVGPDGDISDFQAHFATYHDLPVREFILSPALSLLNRPVLDCIAA